MTPEIQSVLETSFNSAAITIIKYMLIAFICALPFIWINTKLKKKEQQAKDKKEEAKIQRAVQKALEEDRRNRK